MSYKFHGLLRTKRWMLFNLLKKKGGKTTTKQTSAWPFYLMFMEIWKQQVSILLVHVTDGHQKAARTSEKHWHCSIPSPSKPLFPIYEKCKNELPAKLEQQNSCHEHFYFQREQIFSGISSALKKLIYHSDISAPMNSDVNKCSSEWSGSVYTHKALHLTNTVFFHLQYEGSSFGRGRVQSFAERFFHHY